ncbi:hypothetical protein SAMN05216412_101163 [Nitrosospira multiformis]|uniref:Uncharacterized protein n=1 Tax=Nitrosospira multiformis TaxID=1231 RepID=A0A1H9YCY9_9PROT|nr:hypothetical protein [Nitrosospira multiformis]SES66815.1 hypothetical protein SAMN05216412_101163 [Nitrosospira multiformis]
MNNIVKAVLVFFLALLPPVAWGYGGIGAFADGLTRGMQQGMQLRLQQQQLEMMERANKREEDLRQQQRKKEEARFEEIKRDFFAFRDQHPEYDDKDRLAELQSEIKRLRETPGNEGRSMRWFLETGHAAIIGREEANAANISVSAATQGLQIPYDDPKKLVQMAEVFSKNGFADVGFEFIDLAEKAKRKAELNVFQSLLLSDVDSAIDAAKLSGRPFADRPVKLKPNDPNDNGWKIQYEGSPETVVNVKTLFEIHAQIAEATPKSPYAGSFEKLMKER